MVIKDRNQLIRTIKEKSPELTYKELGDLVGLSRQRVHKIVTYNTENDIIRNMERKAIFDKPISATEVSRITGIPTSSIFDWVSRGLVKIISRPDRKACTGQPVLLDPVSLQERIDRYRPRKKPGTSTISA